MKILYLHITQNLGGVEKRFYNYYRYILQKDDNEYTVYISRTFLYKINCELVPLRNNRVIKYGWKWRNTGKLSRYLDYLSLLFHLIFDSHTKYDVIHYPTSASRVFVKYHGSSKKVVSVFTSWREHLYNQVKSSSFSSLMKQGVYVDCLDDNIKDVVLSQFPKDNKRIFVSPCSFINYENTNCCYEHKEHAICFVGRLIAYKGADLLMESLVEIVSTTNFKVYILGCGDLREQIDELIKTNCLESRVVLTYDSNPISYMKKTKVFLSLQKDENYPSQSLIEAMATQNAIIATKVGLTSKIVRDRWGLLISNKEELVSSIMKMEIMNLREMGEEAMKFVVENHNVERFHHYLLNIYKK